MPVRVVESKHNARLKQLRQVLAQPGRGSDGLVGIEGPNLLEEALRAGLRLTTVFVARGAEGVLERLAVPPETEVLQLPRELLDAALTTEAPQPVAALAAPPAWKWEDLFGHKETKALIVVLAGLQDPGNVGTILRSAEAFGATGVVSLPGTVTAWNPKAVRASAGSIFRLPLMTADVEGCFARLRAAGASVLTTSIREAQPADTVDLTRAMALLIGNEGNGVPDEIAQQADGAVTIPCPGPVESLNAAMAASILLYEAARQRRGLR